MDIFRLFSIHIVRIVLYNHYQHLNEDIKNEQSFKSYTRHYFAISLVATIMSKEKIHFNSTKRHRKITCSTMSIPTLTFKTDKIGCCSAHFCIYYDSTYAIIEHDDNYFKWRTSSSCSWHVV